MYKPRYIQYLNLPKIPDSIIKNLPKNFESYETLNIDNYNWTKSHNHDLNEWAQEHISEEMYFAFQIMTGDLPVHKDVDSKTKLLYIIDQGGDNVFTKFWDDKPNLLDEYVIDKNRWHVLKSDTNHSVEGIEQGKLRWSVIARIF
jgi:hypothetical protein